MSKIFHQSVLVNKVLEFLQVKKGEKYIDATIGGGGITREILKRGGHVLGIDWDEEAVGFLKKEFVKEIEDKKLILEQENFVKVSQLAKIHKFTNCAGVIFDLGVSQHQLEIAKRGFSFARQGSLDMRMSKKLAVTAKDLLAVLSQNQLAKLFAKFSEEKATVIASEIVKIRKRTSIETTIQLANIVAAIKKTPKVHPATKIFLALRAATNFELENLRQALPAAFLQLCQKGRLAIISFHSAEDTIVKDFFRHEKGLTILTAKPVQPDFEEVLKNPHARSARLRVGEKTW